MKLATKGFMWKNMVEGNSSYRPEQLLVAKILREMGYTVHTEYEIRGLLPNEFNVKGAIPDVALPYAKVIFRLNGKIHNKKRRIRDEDQKIVLEQKGWTVHDLNEDECQVLWNQKKYSYDEAKEFMRLFFANKV